MITINEYFRHPNSQFNGNPFIEFIPYLNRNSIARMIASPVKCHDEERLHDKELRLQYILRLNNLFAPTDQQIDFAAKLLTAIQMSYVQRWSKYKKDNECEADFYQWCHAVAAHEEIHLSTNESLGGHSFIICMGTCGTGKTSLLMALLSRLPTALLYHPKHKARQFLSITVTSPGTGRDSKTLAHEVYTALFDVYVANGIPAPRLPANSSTAKLRSTAKKLARDLNLGVLIIEEMQHAMRGTAGLDQETMKFLTDFVNGFDVPIVLVGTWKLSKLATIEDRLTRRMLSLENTFFRRAQSPEEFMPFLTALFNIQYTTTFSPLTEKLAKTFYDLTQGINDCAVKLFMLCQYEAIWGDIEEITVDLVEQVAEMHLEMLFPMLKRLKEGVSENDEIFYDSEPVDFAAYLAAMATEDALGKAGRATKGRTTPASEKQCAVRKALVAGSLASATAAAQIAELVVSANPGASVAEHLSNALRPALGKKSPRITSSTKFKVKHDEYFEGLEQDDLRRIAYFARRSNVRVADRFFERSLMPAVTEVLSL